MGELLRSGDRVGAIGMGLYLFCRDIDHTHKMFSTHALSCAVVGVVSLRVIPCSQDQRT